MVETVQKKERAVSSSFSMPKSVSEWLDDYMDRKGVRLSEAIVRAIDALKAKDESDQEASAA